MSTRQTNIPQWVIPFCKILEMEEAHGFNDSAVVGGLDRFVQRWAQPMSEYIPGPGLLTELTHSQYSGMSSTERQAWVTCWRTVLFSEHQSWGDPGLLRTARSGNKPVPTVNPDSKQAQDAPMNVGNSDEQSVVLPSSRAVPIAQSSLSVDAPVDRLRGVDTKLTEKFKRLDVSTIRDLLYLFPRRYNDFSNIAKISELQPGQEYTVAGQLWEARQITMGQQGRLKATEAVLSDETGNVKIIWFGQGYLARSLKPNSRLAVSGKVDVFKGQLVFESPEYDILSSSQPPLHTGRIVPVYPLTEGITGRNMRRLTWQALDSRIGDVAEAVPAAILKRTRLMPLQDAITQAHYPDDEPHQGDARRRLAFDELFILQLAVLSRRRDRDQGVAGIPIEADQQILNGFIASLPFSLTGAQRRCVDEILEDLRRGVHPMNRLLQGEVGSGKTVVVLVALLAVAASGYQGAIMVPTEVLAEQHFHTISRLLAGLARPMQENNLITAYLDTLGRPISVGLLTGSTRARVRKQLVQMAAEGTLDLLVGTHALIQADVDVPKLALAVMDEQHRFGVMQRSALRQRGLENPHSLVMSATPIPRTLSLTLYGDLDISTIDELPPGRQFVQTRWVGPERRLAAYGFLRKQVEEGRQAFIIYPLIDESDTIEARAATDEYKRLSNDVFQDLRLGLLHGRMSAKDKDKVMRQFRDGEVDILVSTAVVEVGIDVANATVMMIEGADRFGLSQLHQFRGRVGRGEHKSYCLLLSDSPSDVAIERLSALEQIHDGFKLAEVDLELRGPGDFFGTRQSGLPNLRMAQLSDRELLAMARTEATLLMESDPALDKPENLALKQQVGRFLDRVSAEFS